MATNEGLVIGDVIVWEANENFCRQDLTVLANNTFVLGQIGCIDNAGKVNTITNAQDEVYTVTEAAGTDGGTFGLRYRGLEVTAQAYNASAATWQTALRALHADLDACVVAGSAGGPYTITIDHSKKSDIHHISKGLDSTADGGVWEGGVTVSRSTLAEQAGVIALEACEESSDATRSFLVRDAIVDAANLTGGTADIYNRLAEPKVADNLEYQAGYGRIFVRTGPTYTTLPVT